MSIDLNEYRIPYQYQVDAFTNKAFGGNPAAVVLKHGTVDWMLNLAAENNLSETAFVEKKRITDNDSVDNEASTEPSHSYVLRW